MNANLHLHSKFSDGSLWPEDIVRGAAHLGLELIALTDHDTMGGSERFAAECAAQGLSCMTACEIDVADSAIGYKSELLAYFPGKTYLECNATRAMLARVLNERRKRLDYYLYWARVFFKREDLSLEDMIQRRKADGMVSNEELSILSWSKVDLFLYLRSKKLVPAYMNYKLFKKNGCGLGGFPNINYPNPIPSLVWLQCMRIGGFRLFLISAIFGMTIPKRWRNSSIRLRFFWSFLGLGVWTGWSCTGIRAARSPPRSMIWSESSPNRWGIFSPMARIAMDPIRTSILSINFPGISPAFPFQGNDWKRRYLLGVDNGALCSTRG